MRRLLVIAVAVAAMLGLGFLAAQVSGQSGAGPVPAIELRQPAPDRDAPGTVEQDGAATRPPAGGNGAQPVAPPSPAPAGGGGADGGDDDDGDDQDDGGDGDDGGGDD